MSETCAKCGRKIGLGGLPEGPVIGLGSVPVRRTPVFTAEPGSYSAGNRSVIPITGGQVNGRWVEVYPSDPEGIAASTNLNSSGLFDFVVQFGSAWLYGCPYGFEVVRSSPGTFGGYVYFGFSDPYEGAAQTPGEPPGMAIMRFSYAGGDQSKPQFGICVAES
jgi:hypothetical protein